MNEDRSPERIIMIGIAFVVFWFGCMFVSFNVPEYGHMAGEVALYGLGIFFLVILVLMWLTARADRKNP